MSNEIKVSEILTGIAELLRNRDGDVLTEDGEKAAFDIDATLNLESKVVEFFGLDSDGVRFLDLPKVYAKSKTYDRLTEENKRLRDLLRKIKEGSWSYVENGEMYDDIEDLLSELGGE